MLTQPNFVAVQQNSINKMEKIIEREMKENTKGLWRTEGPGLM